LSYVFEKFNSVCLATGLVIIIYTMIVGVLQTAEQGKVLGEKWSATWLPIRMVLGIALLVPQPGTGYCLAQSLVMWMVVQGIGGADAIWDRALDYFIEVARFEKIRLDYGR
jgi:defect in organelle trafficking protein DotA